MPHVRQMRIRRGMRLAEITREMGKAGVLGAGRFARAVAVTRMIFRGDYTCLLGLAGPMVAGGLRRLIRDLVYDGYLDAIVSTGANITHDVVEALGYRHIIGSAAVRDASLAKRGIGRIYDINVDMRSFAGLERWIRRLLDEVPTELRRDAAGYELLWEIGRHLKDENSILRTAYKKRVPVLCPGIQDSMLGMNLWTYSTLKTLKLDQLRDLTKLSEVIYGARKVGAIIIGGGLPKHHLLVASTLRGGVDAALQITMDRPEAGGLSGAPLEEAISWRKIRGEKNIATLIGDATLLFPLVVAAALEGQKT
ncbi:deoxyhypusine synthase family protein [Candidatus Bathyarchaeota archaeon]|nr:deoxyhypusine synthase family protein [Candidatus Bathyarchaeota archaeon]